MPAFKNIERITLSFFLFAILLAPPPRILHNTCFYVMELYQPYYGYYFLNALLMIVQLLHVFWSYLIILMVYQFLIHGTVRVEIEHSGRCELEVHVGEEGQNQNLE